MSFRDQSCTKICASCGEPFARDKRCTWAYWGKAKYCGQACAGIANRARLEANRLTKSESFSKWILKSDGCWPWSGAQDKDGYGVFTYGGVTYRAPKMALELDGRPVPKGLYACHTCDNPPCVRPDHLYPGTPSQNMADAIARNRIRHGAKAKLSEDDVVAIRAMAGTHEAIARQFGVSPSNVTMIRQRKTWRRVP